MFPVEKALFQLNKEIILWIVETYELSYEYSVSMKFDLKNDIHFHTFYIFNIDYKINNRFIENKLYTSCLLRKSNENHDY